MNKRIAAGLGALCVAAALLAGCETEQPQSSDTYYTTPEGEIIVGWYENEGDTYYIKEDGAMATGWQEIDGIRCYFRESGSRVTGWLSLDGEKYYLTADGAAAGATAVDGTIYLFDETGLLTSGWAAVDGKHYYGNENGHPVTGWQEIDGVRYYFDEDYAAHTGWLESDGFTYYFTADGTPARGEVVIDEKVHHFAFNGQEVILVNPWNLMPEDYTVELTDIGGEHQVAAIAYDDYNAMMAACKAAGMDPVVCSSYRTQEYQEYLYQRRISRFEDQGYSETEATTLAGTIVALPGTSEHQLGLALDIIDNDNWSLDESQAEMPTQQWLMEHSWEYGWILRYPNEKSEITGIIYEPWHYRYVGREVAADIHESGLCLEEYLDMLTKK